jgi:large subunit ribosomal protein L25
MSSAQTADLELHDRSTNLNPRAIRRNGFIPVTIYGKKHQESLSLQISHLDFVKHSLSNKKQAVKAKQGGKSMLLLIKSIERNPATEEVQNIQFHSLEPETEVALKLPLVFEGVSPLVQAGGTFYINNSVVKVSCPAKSIPASIKLDIKVLAGEKTLAYYSDLIMPTPNIKLLSDVKQIVAKVSVPQVAAEAAPAAKK